MKKFWADIFKDKGSDKFSMTKFATFMGILAFLNLIIMGSMIMWKNKEIDHVLLVEVIGMILTLSGFKNSFGFKKDATQTTLNSNGDGNTDKTVL